MIAAPLPPVFMVAQAMVQCGVPNAPNFGGHTPPQRISTQIFMDSFDTCLSIATEEVSDALMACTKLTGATGRIPLQLGVKCRILAFVQWSRTMLRTDQDPTLLAFPVANIITLTQDLQTCRRFKKQSELLGTQAKPKKFTPETQWMD